MTLSAYVFLFKIMRFHFKKGSNTPLPYYLQAILIAMFRFHTLLILVIADLYYDQVLF